MNNETILRLCNVRKHFGGVSAIEGLSFDVRRGTRAALIGPNGAGKTTVFNLITGVFRLDGGSIFLGDTDISTVKSRDRIRHGVARTFQNVRLIAHLSALENVMVGQHARSPGWRGIFQPVNILPRNRWREEARAALADAGLDGYERLPAGSLPYGVQKRIEVVRALLAKPNLLLLDEPAAGLNPAESEALQVQLETISIRDGLTLLVVEHDMHFIGALCRDVVVLSFGRKIAEGSPADIRCNPEVQEVYLGKPVPQDSGVATSLAEELGRVAQGA